MDASQLPDISSMLVTADNPARDNPSLGMDHVRCAALHNYLIQYAWVAQGRPLAGLQDNNRSFFTFYGARAEALRSRLHPSVAAFLDAVWCPPEGFSGIELFWWVSGLSEPEQIFAEPQAELFDMPVDSLLWLFDNNTGQGGADAGGLYYHQSRHRTAVFMDMDDFDFALPIEAHQELWHPFETVLSNWINVIYLGKVTASPHETPSMFGNEKIGPWEWRPYSEAQVVTCVAAWDQLCEAIEARISHLSPISTAIDAIDPGSLVTSAVLDAASVPQPCFVRAFLTQARRPRFRFIAPGLVLPPTDSSEFVAIQPFSRLARQHYSIPPVCLFPATRGTPNVNISGTRNPFYNGDFGERTTFSRLSIPSHIAAGVYSESVVRVEYDNAEEGFRLFLPYDFKETWDPNVGARRSDGSRVASGLTGQVCMLFQHGYKPFGGEYDRPQRLERLFDCWRQFIDKGIWSVGTEGVEGTIDTFKLADRHWRDYIIPPTW